MPLTVKRVAKLRGIPDATSTATVFTCRCSVRAIARGCCAMNEAGASDGSGLGPLHAFNLDEARTRARQARQQLADGIDPLDARKTERARQAIASAKSTTFEQAAQQYFNFHERKWTNAKYRAQFLSSLCDYAFPVLGKLRLRKSTSALS